MIELKKIKKIVFLTATRADFGKLLPLIEKIEKSNDFENFIFVTGMHTLSKYGSTYEEVKKYGFKNIFVFMNQTNTTELDIILSNTITGFGNFVKEISPDLIVVHGDRLEALAGAIVGSFNNILVSHIEGGEVSGTLDELLRHAITKLSHTHFVSNEEARQRLIQLGELDDNIFVIGSPDIDIMRSDSLPSLSDTKQRYDILFNEYAIFIFHPVVTELDSLKDQIREVVNALKQTSKNYIVIYPNNDNGSDIILEEIKTLEHLDNFRIFPSIQFQYFLTLLKNASFIIGNSSVGVREAEVYGVPSINIGSRQNNRNKSEQIKNINPKKVEVINAINKVSGRLKPENSFGSVSNSNEKFFKILTNNEIWRVPIQKQFIDLKK